MGGIQLRSTASRVNGSELSNWNFIKHYICFSNVRICPPSCRPCSLYATFKNKET